MTLSFLDGDDSPELIAPALTEAADTAAEPPAEGPARGEDGRFVPKASDAAPTAETPPTTAPVANVADVATPDAPDLRHVPLTAHLDEREKRQKAEQERDAYAARIAALEAAQQPAEAPVAPDPYEDPDGFNAYQQEQVGRQIFETNRYWSRKTAEIQHGADLVAKAHEWGFQRCAEDPFFNQKVKSSNDIYGLVIAEYQRATAPHVAPSEYEQFLAWKAAQSTGATVPGLSNPAPGPSAAAPSPQSAPPRSLASAPAAGSHKPGDVPTGPGVAFDAAFER